MYGRCCPLKFLAEVLNAHFDRTVRGPVEFVILFGWVIRLELEVLGIFRRDRLVSDQNGPLSSLTRPKTTTQPLSVLRAMIALDRPFLHLVFLDFIRRIPGRPVVLGQPPAGVG